jgi:hypothetical protein
MSKSPVRPYQSFRKPRCVLVYALAPKGMPAAEANRIFNTFVGDRSLPLVVYHDHFIGTPGGLAIFYVASARERSVLYEQTHLEDWRVEFQPLIFSYSPAAFDDQIAFTLRQYRDLRWDAVRGQRYTTSGDASRDGDRT